MRQRITRSVTFIYDATGQNNRAATVRERKTSGVQIVQNKQGSRRIIDTDGETVPAPRRRASMPVNAV